MPSHPVKKKAVFSILLTGISLFTALLFVEGIVRYILLAPEMVKHFPPNLFKLSSKLYFLQRTIPQFTSGFGRYDSELTYTLVPGKRRFSGPEFNTEVSVNSLGVRDSEESLEKPQVVVLGDSFSMGWGVEQDESYPELISKKTSLRILNASIPSYGTVRERKLLDRIDTSQLKAIILQYSTNDFGENASFYKERGQLKTLPPETYQAIINLSAPSLFGFIPNWIYKKVSGRSAKLASLMHEPPPEVDISEARLFLNAWDFAGKKDLHHVPVIVFHALERGESEGKFFEELNQAVSEYGPSPLHVLDLSSLQVKANYFVMDDHWNKQGHEKIAQELEDALSEFIQIAKTGE